MSDITLKFGIETDAALVEFTKMVRGLRSAMAEFNSIMVSAGASAGKGLTQGLETQLKAAGDASGKAYVDRLTGAIKSGSGTLEKTTKATFDNMVKDAAQAGESVARALEGKYRFTLGAAGVPKISFVGGLDQERGARLLADQVAAAKKEAIDKLRAASASRIDPRTLLGLPSRDEMKSIGAEIAAQFREGAAREMAQLNALKQQLFHSQEAMAYRGRGKLIYAAAQMQDQGADIGQVFPPSVIASIPHLEKYKSQLKDVADKHKETGDAARLGALHAGHWRDTAWEAHSAARGLAGSLGLLWTTWGSTVPIVAAATLASTLREVYQEGKKVEYQLAFVRGLSGQSLSMASVERATSGSMFGLAEGAEGLRALAQSGLSAKESIAALPDVLNLATVGEVSVGEAAFAATGVMKAFSLSVEDVARVSNVLAKGAAVSNASVSDMMQAMKYASTAGALYGESLEDTATFIALLSEKNIKGSMAGTAHANALRELYTPTRQAAAAFKQVGIDVQAMQREGLSSIQKLERIRVAIKDLDEPSRRSFIDVVGGERGKRELAPLLEGPINGFAKIREAIDSANEGLGFTKTVMMELSDTTEGASKRMSRSLKTAFAEAFEQNSGAIQMLLDNIARLFSSSGFKEFISDLASGMANLSRMVVDHIDLIKALVVAYAGMKALSIGSSIASMAVSSISSSGALRQLNQDFKAFKLEAELASAVSNGTATALRGVEAGAGLVSTGVGLASRSLTMLTGALGVALAAVTTGITMWQLFASKTNDAENAQARLKSRLDATSDALQREIDRLKERNALYREGKDPDSGDAGMSIQGQLAATKSQIREMETARFDMERRVFVYRDANNKEQFLKEKDYYKQLAILREAYDKQRVQVPALQAETTADQQFQAKSALSKMVAKYREYAAETTVDTSELKGILDRVESMPEHFTDPKQVEGLEKALKLALDLNKESRAFRPDNAHDTGNVIKSLVQDLESKIKQAEMTFKFQKEIYDIRVKHGVLSQGAANTILEDEEEKTRKLTEAYRAQELVKLRAYLHSGELNKSGRLEVLNKIEAIELLQQEAKARDKHVLAMRREIDAGKELQTAQTLKSDIADLQKSSGLRLQKINAKEITDPVEKAGVDAFNAAMEAGKQKLEAWEKAVRDADESLDRLLATEGTSLETLGAQWDHVVRLKQAYEAYKRALESTSSAEKMAAEVRTQEAMSWSHGVSKAFNGLNKDAGFSARNAERLFTNAFSKMEDAIVEFAKTGKINFRSLADSIINEMLRIAAQQMVMDAMGTKGKPGWLGLAATAISAWAGGGGGGSDLGSFGATTVNGGGNWGNILVDVAHTGGVVGNLTQKRSAHPSLFNNAPRFHTGGIVGDEVPIIARRGEGVFTQEQMRAMGGGSNVYNTTISVDATGGKVQGDQGKAWELGKRIKDAVQAVLIDEKRPGGILAA